MLDELSSNTPAEKAQDITRPAPNRFICWNCCGLRFESDAPEAVCPTCGHVCLPIPADVTPGVAVTAFETRENESSDENHSTH